MIGSEENDKENEPKLSIPFYLDTTYLKQKFTLDIVVWNLTASNLAKKRKTRNGGRNFYEVVKKNWDCALIFAIYTNCNFCVV